MRFYYACSAEEARPHGQDGQRLYCLVEDRARPANAALGRPAHSACSRLAVGEACPWPRSRGGATAWCRKTVPRVGVGLGAEPGAEPGAGAGAGAGVVAGAESVR